jgi:hypothetical protein
MDSSKNKQEEQDLNILANIRELNVDYKKHEEHTQKSGASQLKIDETNYKVFPLLDENAEYKINAIDYRWDMQPDCKKEMPDYSGAFTYDLRFTDFSNAALINLLWASYEYYELLFQSWAAEVALRKGADTMIEIQAAAWNTLIPKIPSMVEEFEGFTVDKMPEIGSDVIVFSPFKPDERYSQCDKARLVKMALGSHEFGLRAIEEWSTQVIMRYGLDEMFSIQWDLWSDKVLPKTRDIKIKWMNVDGGDTTPVEAFMKDIQLDATSFPGKAFEMTFEMPDRNTGIVGFNKCCAVDQWEALGRPDILKKNCHAICPASMIETGKMYHPNFKVDVLAIPPRKSKEHVCCRVKLSMREKSDPEYVAV